MSYDVIIVGGGPGGLQAALTLGRARKRVLLCDAGSRRNAAAVEVHNFVTRDGTPPDEFRTLAREQLAAYPSVEVRDAHVASITGARGAFAIAVDGGTVEARRVLLATGMIDEPPAIPGVREHWGHSIFQCPYCHGWEVRERPWGYLAMPGAAAHVVPFTLMLRGWSKDVVLFTNGALEVPDEARGPLQAAGVRIESGRIERIERIDREQIVLASGTPVRCDALFMHPPQRHVDVVRALGLALDDEGYVKVDPMRRETSVPGIYAAGDLTTRAQSAVIAASLGMQTAAAINMELTMELAVAGAL